jgi:hypothetical protein
VKRATTGASLAGALALAIIVPASAGPGFPPPIGIHTAVQKQKTVDVRVAIPGDGVLTVRGGADLKKKKVPKLVKARSVTVPPGPATVLVRVPLTRVAERVLEDKGRYKLVLGASFAPSSGAGPSRDVHTLMLKR